MRHFSRYTHTVRLMSRFCRQPEYRRRRRCTYPAASERSTELAFAAHGERFARPDLSAPGYARRRRLVPIMRILPLYMPPICPMSMASSGLALPSSGKRRGGFTVRSSRG